MAGEIYRDGEIHLSPEIQDLYTGIRNLVGAPNVPLILQKVHYTMHLLMELKSIWVGDMWHSHLLETIMDLMAI